MCFHVNYASMKVRSGARLIDAGPEHSVTIILLICRCNHCICNQVSLRNQSRETATPSRVEIGEAKMPTQSDRLARQSRCGNSRLESPSRENRTPDSEEGRPRRSYPYPMPNFRR
jgi:hypothetical protein